MFRCLDVAAGLKESGEQMVAGPGPELNPELFRPAEQITNNLHISAHQIKRTYRLITADHGMTSRKERLKYTIKTQFLSTGWSQKSNYSQYRYHESSLNRIKTCHERLDFSPISTTKWTQELNSLYEILYTCDLICDVITCSGWSCNTGKISASDKIIFENQKKRKYGSKHFYINLHQKDRLDIKFTAC